MKTPLEDALEKARYAWSNAARVNITLSDPLRDSCAAFLKAYLSDERVQLDMAEAMAEIEFKEEGFIMELVEAACNAALRGV